MLKWWRKPMFGMAAMGLNIHQMVKLDNLWQMLFFFFPHLVHPIVHYPICQNQLGIFCVIPVIGVTGNTPPFRGFGLWNPERWLICPVLRGARLGRWKIRERAHSFIGPATWPTILLGIYFHFRPVGNCFCGRLWLLASRLATKSFCAFRFGS